MFFQISLQNLYSFPSRLLVMAEYFNSFFFTPDIETISNIANIVFTSNIQTNDEKYEKYEWKYQKMFQSIEKDL